LLVIIKLTPTNNNLTRTNLNIIEREKENKIKGSSLWAVEKNKNTSVFIFLINCNIHKCIGGRPIFKNILTRKINLIRTTPISLKNKKNACTSRYLNTNSEVKINRNNQDKISINNNNRNTLFKLLNRSKMKK